MTCRAATSANSCAGNSPNGAPLTWDTEGRLVEWTSPTGAPWASSIDLYDGEGTRVQQQTVAGGVTTQTYYIGNLEEVSVAGGVTTTTTYYYAGNGGPRIATAVNGVFSYLASDTLGTAEVALDANGNTTAAQLYAPYGTTRYSSGTMPGSYGYTGQRADAVTGLDYYGARYYDAVAGVFASADTVLPGKGYDVWGLSRYAYVEGNPITRSDPSGHRTANCGDGTIGGACGQDPRYFILADNLSTANNYDAMAGGGAGAAHGYLEGWARYYRSVNGSDEWDTRWYVNKVGKTIGVPYKTGATLDETAQIAEATKWGKVANRVGLGLLIVGGLLDAGISGLDYYNADTKDPGDVRVEKAAVDGLIHGAIVTGFAYGGAIALGTLLGAAGTMVCPGLGTALGGAAGEALGGFAGGLAGGMVADFAAPLITNWAFSL